MSNIYENHHNGLLYMPNKNSNHNYEFKNLIIFFQNKYTSDRLLKLYNMNIEIELVVLWITLIHHWPYHTTWLIIYLEDLNASNSINSNKEQNLEVKINLMEAFLEVFSWYLLLICLMYIFNIFLKLMLETLHFY